MQAAHGTNQHIDAAPAVFIGIVEKGACPFPGSESPRYGRELPSEWKRCRMDAQRQFALKKWTMPSVKKSVRTC